MKVIVNADDFGYCNGVTDGIIYAHKNGIVTSTTIMCNSLGIIYAKEQSKDCTNLGIGIHLTLTCGSSLTKNNTLTNDYGKFHNRASINFKELDAEEIYKEFKAQINRFIEVFERVPTHIDSHHHVHIISNKVSEVVSRLAQEYNLKVRNNSDYTFISDFYGEAATKSNLINKFDANKNIEIMCHPSIIDLDLYKGSTYCFERIKELDILCSNDVLEYIKDNNIQLVHY